MITKLIAECVASSFYTFTSSPNRQRRPTTLLCARLPDLRPLPRLPSHILLLLSPRLRGSTTPANSSPGRRLSLPELEWMTRRQPSWPPPVCHPNLPLSRKHQRKSPSPLWALRRRLHDLICAKPVDLPCLVWDMHILMAEGRMGAGVQSHPRWRRYRLVPKFLCKPDKRKGAVIGRPNCAPR